MKIIFTAVAILLSAGTLSAQNEDNNRFETKGFFINGSLMGAAWTIDGLDIDTESGGGAGLKLGYNFGTHFGIFTSLDAAIISSEEDDDIEYVLSHFDIGVQGILRPATARFRPFLRASLSGMSAQDEDVEINGAGFGIGGGALIFVTRNLAFDINYTHGIIDLTEVKFDSETFDIDESATTGRLFVGLGWYF